MTSMNDDTANPIDNLKRAAAQVRLAAIENRLTKITGDLRRALKAGYNPSQPRRRDGTPQSGWWSSNRYLDDTDKIVAAAQRFRLAAFSERYSSCVDLCYPLLERRQPVGSDFNLWDYHKCLNRCLGR